MTVPTQFVELGAGGVADRLVAPPVVVFAELSAPRLEGIHAVAALLGAAVSATTGPDAQPRSPQPAAALLGVRSLLSAGDAVLSWAKTLVYAVPVLLFPETGEDIESLPTAYHQLTGDEIRLTPAAPGSVYELRHHDPAWPFPTIELKEDASRALVGLRGVPESSVLIRGASGPVAIWDADRRLSVTVQPPLQDRHAAEQLRHRLRTADFLGVLPLIQFLRVALGDAAWRSDSVSAAFMIDDPNLRSLRYGYVHYGDLVEAGDRHEFHTIIAAAPIDLRKTRPGPAGLFRQRPDRLSLVMHGVHHSHHEFAQHAARGEAVRRMVDGLRRAQVHADRHGLTVPPIMTFPFGRVNSMWLQAMREVGLTAAIASTAYPFIFEQRMLSPDYELLPAEMGHQGFPVIPRHWPGTPVTDYLFHALLGRPLVVYGHHVDYKDGLKPFAHLADWLNIHVAPRWRSAAGIAAANFQVRQTPAGTALRTFSNRIELPALPEPVSVLKPHGDRGRQERAWLEGAELATLTLPGTGIAVEVPPGPAGRTLVFGARLEPGGTARRGLPPVAAHGRRLLTEMRDRAMPVQPRRKS